MVITRNTTDTDYSGREDLYAPRSFSTPEYDAPSKSESRGHSAESVFRPRDAAWTSQERGANSFEQRPSLSTSTTREERDSPNQGGSHEHSAVVEAARARASARSGTTSTGAESIGATAPVFRPMNGTSPTTPGGLRAYDERGSTSKDRRLQSAEKCDEASAHDERPEKTAAEVRYRFDHNRRHRDEEYDRRDRAMGQQLSSEAFDGPREELVIHEVKKPAERWTTSRRESARADDFEGPTSHFHNEEMRMQREASSVLAGPLWENKPIEEKPPQSRLGAWMSAVGGIFSRHSDADKSKDHDTFRTHSRARSASRGRESEREREPLADRDGERVHEERVHSLDLRSESRRLRSPISPMSPAIHEAGLARPADSDMRCALSLVYE